MGISQDNVFYLGLIRNIEKNKILVNPSNFLEFLENSYSNILQYVLYLPIKLKDYSLSILLN